MRVDPSRGYTLGVQTLSYAPATLSPPPKRRPLWIDLAVWLIAIPTLALVTLALPPSWGAIDYTRWIPLSEVFDYSFRAESLRDMLASPRNAVQAAGVLLALATLAIFSRFRSVPASITCASIAAAMPLMWWGPLYFLGPLMLIGDVPRVLVGRADGEVWSEGWIELGAWGLWLLLWLATLAVVLCTRKSWPIAQGRRKAAPREGGGTHETVSS